MSINTQELLYKQTLYIHLCYCEIYNGLSNLIPIRCSYVLLLHYIL